MRARLVVLVATAALAAVASAAAATSEFRITEASGAAFPTRSYVLSLPREMHLESGAVRVSENGRGVADLRVTAVGEDKSKNFGVVLVIDASLSMRGKPFTAALDAARALAARRRPNQLLGVVTFNNTATVQLPLTADQAAITRALEKPPPLVFGTHVYDAVDRAATMLVDRNVEVGSIVLLSDGADTGSLISEAQAATKAREAHIRMYTVGLNSRFLEARALEKLAQDVGGSYTFARSLTALRPIYEDLGSRLAREYLVQYRSLVSAGTHVEVRVRVAGLAGTAAAAYESPSVPVSVPGAKSPYEISVSHRVWTSLVTTTLVAILAAGLFGLGVFALLSGPKQGTVRKRMAEFVSVPAVLRDRQRPTAQLTDKMLDGTETIFGRSSWWQRFRWELDVAQVTTPPEQIVVLTLIGALLALVFVKFVTGSLLVAIIIALLVPYAARSVLKRNLARRRAQFAESLPDNLQVLSSALRAGHSFIGALSVVVKDAPEPARSEFQRVIADEQLGVPIDEALHVVVERMENRELEQVALVAALQRESGGNTAEVLDRVTDTIRERFELRRTVRSLTAQGRMSRWVLTLLPITLFLFIALINPGYMSTLYTSTAGKVLLAYAAISVAAGSIVIKKIVDIKV